MKSSEVFATSTSEEPLPYLISAHCNYLIKTGKGIDPILQENKVTNIDIASKGINKTVIHPGETFSFWKRVGKTTEKRGFKDGRVITGDKLIAGIGGGLCNLSNTINWLIIHSPLEITEFHLHSDALAPDHGKRVPLSAGTSISYNNIDYRFKNNTEHDVQILTWVKDKTLYAELRSEQEFPWEYEILEEGHCFRKYGDKYFRDSKIYRITKDKTTKEIVEKKLLVDNHSEVMFDYSLIPAELIKE